MSIIDYIYRNVKGDIAPAQIKFQRVHVVQWHTPYTDSAYPNYIAIQYIPTSTTLQ